MTMIDTMVIVSDTITPEWSLNQLPTCTTFVWTDSVGPLDGSLEVPDEGALCAPATMDTADTWFWASRSHSKDVSMHL